jgi:hypothetical protein
VKSNPWRVHPDETPFASPDGKKEFLYTHAEEIRMGSPLSATGLIKTQNENYHLKPLFGIPPIWSDCSKYLAIPYWNYNYSQKIALININTLEIKLSAKNYRVLTFKSFKNNVITGVDSPEYKPDYIEVNIQKMQFSNIIKIT